jgi:hypothetical protein
MVRLEGEQRFEIRSPAQQRVRSVIGAFGGDAIQSVFAEAKCSQQLWVLGKAH